VQSWAAATMLNCGPTHHRMAGQATAAAEPSHSQAVDGHGAHSGHDASSHHHEVAFEGHVDPGQADVDQPLPLGKFKCSACASCCLGMALPSPILTIDASVSSDTVLPGMAQGHVVFLTAGLERPPRTLFA
jgi:hypothetical protein